MNLPHDFIDRLFSVKTPTETREVSGFWLLRQKAVTDDLLGALTALRLEEWIAIGDRSFTRTR
jgi:hypothetical protein